MSLEKIHQINHLSKQIQEAVFYLKEFLGITRRDSLSRIHQCLPYPERKLHAYCIGLPRSGTTSITSIFSPHFLSRHEPQSKCVVNKILRLKMGSITPDSFVRWLLNRDKCLHLDLESAHYLHHIVDVLVRSFPDAYFILTVREPTSWIESEINQNILSKGFTYWKQLEKFRYARYDNKYICHKLKTVEGVYPVLNYLDYWSDHIKKVVKCVPDDQLLLLNTFNIGENLTKIANQLNVRSELLNSKKTHKNKRQEKFSLFNHVSPEEIRSLIKNHRCYELINNKLKSINISLTST